MNNPFLVLFSSTKWLVTIAAIIAVAVITAIGNLGSQEFIDALKWLVGIGVASRAIEDGLAKRPNGK